MPPDLPPPIDPPTQAALLMTLLGFVLLGIGMIAATMIGARWVRKLNRSKPNQGWQPDFQSNEPIDYVGTEETIKDASEQIVSEEETQADSTHPRETKVE